MNRIIGGKRYDTETARQVGRWANGYGGSDYAATTLYRKRTGEYFLHVEHAEFASDLMHSESIQPVSYDEALRWAEAHMDADAVEREFSLDDGGETVPLTARVPSSLKSAVEREAARRGVSISALVGSILDDALRER